MTMRRKLIVALAVVGYVASNVVLGFVIAGVNSTDSRVTKIEKVLKVERVTVRGGGHANTRRVLSPAVPRSTAPIQPHAPTMQRVIGGRTTHQGGTRTTPPRHGHPRSRTGPSGGSGSVGSGGSGGSNAITIPSQHVGPVTTPSVTVPLPALPPLP